jgi:hypothetical protein
LGCFFWHNFLAEFIYLSRMSFCCAAGIALCFSEERRKQCAMCAAGGKKYASAAPPEKTTKGWRAAGENPADYE